MGENQQQHIQIGEAFKIISLAVDGFECNKTQRNLLDMASNSMVNYINIAEVEKKELNELKQENEILKNKVSELELLLKAEK